MATVAVYNIEGKEVDKLELNDVLKYLVAEESRGDRREQVMQDRVLQDLHSGQAVVLYLHQSQEITL